MLVLALLVTVVPMNLTTKVNAYDESVCHLELQNGQVAIYVNINISGVTSVKFPTWTPENGGQDDIVWYDGWQGSWTINGYTYNWATIVPLSDHNYESGAYATHIYYNNGNGDTMFTIMNYTLNTCPSVVRVTYVQDGTSGYTVYAYVEDNGLYPITKVQCPTWTEYNGQDDLASDWSSVSATYGNYTVNGVYYNESFYVSFAAHNNETGKYITHVYAFNELEGHQTCKGVEVTPNFTSPTVERVKFVQDGGVGYYAYAYVSTNGGLDINRVQFPSWTTANGQDDLDQTGWSTSSAYTGTAGNWTVDGQTYNYRYHVAVADHNNEYGTYATNVCAYNNANLSASYGIQKFEFNFTLTIDDGDGTYAGESSISGKYGNTANIANPTAPEGYHFKQWNLSGSGTFDKNSGVYTFAGGDGTITAEYEAHSYTTYVSQDTAATCTSNALGVYACSCGATATLEVPDTKLEHKFTVLQSDENGHWYKCEDCNATTASTAHSYTAENVDAKYLKSSATCTAKAVYYKSCSVCGEASDTDTFENGDKLAHDWDDGVITTNPTCKDKGEKTYTCKREGCGETYTEEVATLNHDWDDGVITTNPTCKDKGEKTYTCKREGCGETYTEEVAALKHIDEDGDSVCDLCGETIKSTSDDIKTGKRCKLCDWYEQHSDKNGIVGFFYSLIHFIVHILYIF